MFKSTKIVAVGSLIVMIVFSCSTEKNTFINRNFHSLTAHYNGYYNANELIDNAMSSYQGSRLEDYYMRLPIDPMPGDSEVVSIYPAIDTAIAKCKKVIRNHSMPSNDRPAKKKEEHNRWIDENWTTIGIASFYRRDYEGAMKSFEYVRKFYKNDPSLFVGQLWMAKTNIAQGKLTEAKLHLDNLDRAIEEEELRNEKKKGFRPSFNLKKPRKKKSKKDEIAKFPKHIRFELEKTKADLALLKGETIDAINYLEQSIEQARMGDDKGRVHFILGQLYQEVSNYEKSKFHYSKVIAGKARYEMSFNARLKRAFLGNGEKVKKELNKMLKDAKNAEYKDQIYYAMAEVEFNENDEREAIYFLHQSAFYSTTNTRQKGMAYERLADLSFLKRNYVPAQKYYDSCAQVITDAYPNAETIRNKANNLAALVRAVETSQKEDSLQRIASMDEKSRVKFLKDVIKQIKEEEAARKKREAERLRELQKNQLLASNTGNGSKWYWNNDKSRTEGLEDFKRLWGQRENEDDWRRSGKIPDATFTSIEDATLSDSLRQEPEDTLTVAHLMTFVPLTDSMLALSNERLMEGYYAAGIIYKEQLSEPQMAEDQFLAALSKDLKSDPHDLMSAFQLYKLKENSNSAVANEQKEYIMNNYPNSDYANFLRDSDYFVKKKERDALAVKDYVKFLNRYSRGLYYPVILKANDVIENEKENIYRSKYMLLKAMCLGQTENNKSRLLPVLEQLIAEYPEADEVPRAKEMIDIIQNGYSENIPADFSNKYPFVYNDQVKMTIVVFLGEKTSVTSAKTRVSNFNREYFSREKLKVVSKIYGKDQGILLISNFSDEMAASNYIRAYKTTKKHLLEMRNAQIVMITKDNLRVLLTKQNKEDYELFYKEYY